MEGLRKLTYKLSSTNILNQVTLENQYTHSMIENNTHMHFFFLHFSFFIIHFSFFIFHFFFYIYTNVHTLNMNKISLKDYINNG